MTDEQPSRLRDAGFERHFLEQVRRGLELTPLERLQWLENTMSELSGWVGRAREGRPVSSPGEQEE